MNENGNRDVVEEIVAIYLSLSDIKWMGWAGKYEQVMISCCKSVMGKAESAPGKGSLGLGTRHCTFSYTNNFLLDFQS